MAISIKATDQLTTKSGTMITTMKLSPFTHLETTEETVEAGIACQPYGVVMAPADADEYTPITFKQGDDIKDVDLRDILDAAEDGEVVCLKDLNAPKWINSAGQPKAGYTDAAAFNIKSGSNVYPTKLYVLNRGADITNNLDDYITVTDTTITTCALITMQAAPSANKPRISAINTPNGSIQAVAFTSSSAGYIAIRAEDLDYITFEV